MFVIFIKKHMHPCMSTVLTTKFEYQRLSVCVCGYVRTRAHVRACVYVCVTAFQNPFLPPVTSHVKCRVKQRYSLIE